MYRYCDVCAKIVVLTYSMLEDVRCCNMLE